VKILTFNVHGLPSPFVKEKLRAIRSRSTLIEAELWRYDVYCLQEDFLKGFDGHHGGGWLRRSGLTLNAASERGGAGGLECPLRDVDFKAYKAWGPHKGDGWARKGFQRCRIHETLLANTHMDAGGRSGDREARSKQRARLKRKIPALGPAILAGDFNPDDAEERSELRDWAAGMGFIQASVDTEKGRDFIFTRDLQTKDHGEDAQLTALSDHPALWIDVTLPVLVGDD
jgi:endonuclease/exonuclease/phosphatase family metal-dependent hydrolase